MTEARLKEIEAYISQWVGRSRSVTYDLIAEVRRLRGGLESIKQSLGLSATEWAPRYVQRIALLGVEE